MFIVSSLRKNSYTGYVSEVKRREWGRGERRGMGRGEKRGVGSGEGEGEGVGMYMYR